ncbi:MAG: tetratricopeptide repeat protein [Pseudomonadota bacterium]
MSMINRNLLVLALSATLFVSACESAEEKAEAFYESGLALLEEGDADRATVEFRNVLTYDEEHEDARRQLARIFEDKGDLAAAYTQYRRLSEQNPELADIRQSMARIALSQQSWDEAERHGRKAVELDPTSPLSQAIRISLDYRQAAIDDQSAARAALAQEAKALVAADADDILSRRVVIAHAMEQNRLSEALDNLDVAIAQDPDNLAYYGIKLQALSALQEFDAIEALLQDMYQTFPDNDRVQQSLISFYLQREDFEGAEAFLRDLAGDDTGDPIGFVPVIQLLEEARGRDAAKAELERLIAANPDNPGNTDFYRTLLAEYRFDDGERDAAIAELQDIVETAEPGDLTRQIKGSLATMLLRTDNQVGSRAIVEEILLEDAANVPALKLRARMLIEADQAGEAILDLRNALDQNPRDTSIILLLAAAHERNGSPELQGERLATAVEVSGSAPRESLLYADYLLRNDRRSAARSVLADARNANPTNLDILSQSARLALDDNAIGIVRGIIADVEKLQDRPNADALLQSLRTSLLLHQDRIDEGLAILQEQAGDGGENTGAVYAVIRTHLQEGQFEQARDYLDDVLAANPDDINLRMMNAALLLTENNPAGSQAALRGILRDDPGNLVASSQLYTQLRRAGQPDAARTVLNAALERSPDAERLMLFQAGELETDGNIEGAIEIYEDLYARNTSNVLIANNLASLLSAFRDDPDSQTRAAAVARRLRGTEIPAFQDTYGWIAYQQGDFEEALTYLEPAAAGLPGNALVQYHLGMTYAALDRTEDARAALTRALEIAGPDTTLPQMKTARDTLDAFAAN